MLMNKNFELALELRLLGRVGISAVVGNKAGHILDDHQAQFVTSPVEQIRFNFDLQASQFSIRPAEDVWCWVKAWPLTCFRTALKPRLLSIFRSDTMASLLGGA